MAVSATSTLFFGIFVESASLLIAAKSFASTRKYESVFLQLKRAVRSSDSLYARVPLEVWDRIKDQLLELYLDHFTAQFIIRMSCNECVHSNDQRLDVIGAMDDYEVSLPTTLKAFREWSCCDCLETAEHIGFYTELNWLQQNQFTLVKLTKFLLSLNLYVVDPIRLSDDFGGSITPCLAIGYNKNVSIHCDRDVYLQHSPSTVSLSSQAFTSFDSSAIDKGCNALLDIYRVEAVNCEPQRRNDLDSLDLELDLPDSKRAVIPAWRIYVRINS